MSDMPDFPPVVIIYCEGREFGPGWDPPDDVWLDPSNPQDAAEMKQQLDRKYRRYAPEDVSASPLSAAAMKAAAVEALHPEIRSLISRGEAARTIEALPDPTPDALLADALQVPEVKALVEAAQLMVRAYEGDFETIQGYYALQSVLDALGVKHD